jgi:hypothetical protein
MFELSRKISPAPTTGATAAGGKPGVEGNEARCGKRTGDRLAQNATVITKMKFHFTTMLKYKFHFATVIAQQNQRRAGVRWPPSL